MHVQHCRCFADSSNVVQQCKRFSLLTSNTQASGWFLLGPMNEPRTRIAVRRKRRRRLVVTAVCWAALFVGPADAATTPPAAIRGLSAWFDASDSSTISATSATVAQLEDKSGHGATMIQPAAAAQPFLRPNSLNGLPTIDFNGTSDFLCSTTGFPTSSDFTIVYLGEMTGTGSNNLFSDYAQGAKPHAFWGGGSAQMPSLWTSGTWLTSPTVGTSPFFSVATYDSAGRVGKIYNNGTTTPATGSGGSATTDASIEIGGYNGAGNFLTGMLGEAFVYSRTLSTTERQSVEGYLACKWGLQSNLPSGHPYANACPTGFDPSQLSNLSAWYDASDPNVVMNTSGTSSVTAWRDKSGSAITLVAPYSSTTWPTLAGNSINGQSTLVFNGAQYLYSSTGFPTGSDYSIATVALFSTLSGINNNILSSYLNNGTTHALYGRNGTTPTMFQSGDIVSAASTGSAAFLAVGTSQTGNGATSIYVDGGSAVSGTAANKTVVDPSIEVGGYTGGANFLGGDIAEAIVYHSVLSTAERQFVEGYLACRWGLQASLPASHPYRATCPSTATASLGLSLNASPASLQSPGALLTYTTSFTNSSGTIVYDPQINAVVPDHTLFAVGSATTSLGNTGLSAAVSYSKDGGANYTYPPASGAGGAPSGYDANVTDIRWKLTGAVGAAASINSGSTTCGVLVQ
jgi:hypothetical protein